MSGDNATLTALDSRRIGEPGMKRSKKRRKYATREPARRVSENVWRIEEDTAERGIFYDASPADLDIVRAAIFELQDPFGGNIVLNRVSL